MKKIENIDEFLESLPEDERLIVDELREIVFQCLPSVKEKLSYNVPYYYGKKRICYIWPASIPWGKVKFNGVSLGFCYGYLINNDLNYLDTDGRKQIATKTFTNVDDINETLLRKYLFEALEFDENL